MEHYLYFAEGGGADASTEAVCYRASRFTGVEPITATTTGIYFESPRNDLDEGGGVGDLITVTHADTTGSAGIYHHAKLIAEEMAEVLNSGPHANGKTTSVIDLDNSIYFGRLATIGITGIVVSLDS